MSESRSGRATPQAPPSPIGETKTRSYYTLPNGEQIEIDPQHPEEAEAKLPGRILYDIPEKTDPLFMDPSIRNLYDGDQIDEHYFDEVRYLPLGKTYMMAPGIGAPFMDPYGIMNPYAQMEHRHASAAGAQAQNIAQRLSTISPPQKPKRRWWFC